MIMRTSIRALQAANYSLYCFCHATSKKNIPNLQQKVEKFAYLQFKLIESRKRVQDLSKQCELAQLANVTTTLDMIRKILCRMTGSHFETRAIQELRKQLISHRTNLEKKIEQSDKKWHGPREQILKLRKQITSDFLSKFIHLEDQMANIVNYKIKNTELAQGAELTQRMLLTTLEKHGIEFYMPEAGVDFNANEHESADVLEGKNIKVEETVARGWKIEGKVIKKSVVKLKKTEP